MNNKLYTEHVIKITCFFNQTAGRLLTIELPIVFYCKLLYSRFLNLTVLTGSWDYSW